MALAFGSALLLSACPAEEPLPADEPSPAIEDEATPPMEEAS
ncbi:MAG TPA: hypothetical protein VK875_10695 [Euzebyales bacterium]|nr:hypothetical protein [Euzebyales bacterium]